MRVSCISCIVIAYHCHIQHDSITLQPREVECTDFATLEIRRHSKPDYTCLSGVWTYQCLMFPDSTAAYSHIQKHNKILISPDDRAIPRHIIYWMILGIQSRSNTRDMPNLPHLRSPTGSHAILVTSLNIMRSHILISCISS